VKRNTAKQLHELIAEFTPVGEFDEEFQRSWVDGDIDFAEMADKLNAMIAEKESEAKP
jgi:hypothetical protein